MTRKLRAYGSTAIILVALGSLCYLVARFRPSMPILSPLGQQSVSSALGGLIGALGATLGIVINDWYKDQRKLKADLAAEDRRLAHERRVLHYNDLIKLNRELVLLYAMLGDNIVAIKSLIQASDQGAVNFRRPVHLPTDEAHFLKLADLKLAQMLSDLYYDIRRLNLDSQGIGRTLDELGELRLKAIMSPEIYKNHTTHIRSQMSGIVDFIEYLIAHRLREITAYVRLATNVDKTPDMIKRSNGIVASRKSSITDEAVKAEMKVVSREGQEIMDADVAEKAAWHASQRQDQSSSTD